MAMSRHDLNDEQWAVIEPLIPKQKAGPGRKRADDRKTLNGILYVLKTGRAWEDLPHEYGSDTTCWRRLNEWLEDGTWERIWRTLLSQLDAEQIFFIELGTRHVHLAGCTEHPTSTRVTQQARQLCWTLEDRVPACRYLLHDWDAKFTTAFDHVFVAQNVKVIHTPIRAPNANAYAERWVRSIRQERLDHLIIVNERHLNSVLRDYVSYYNNRRPHQGLGQSRPAGIFESINTGTIYRREVLGGLIGDYIRQAA